MAPSPRHLYLSLAIVLTIVALWQQCYLIVSKNCVDSSQQQHQSRQSMLNYTEHGFMVSRVYLKYQPQQYFWMAHHDIDLGAKINGADWYKQAWERNVFDGTGTYEHVLTALGACDGNRQGLYVQAGSHEGVFGFVAAKLGCSVMLLEGSELHVSLMRLTTSLNGWDGRVLPLRAIISNREMPIYFVGDVLAFNADQARKEGERRKKVIEEGTSQTLDSVVPINGVPHGAFAVQMLVVDVEGHEQQVLLGARHLIKRRLVRVFEIEVWLINNNNASDATTHVTSFPGLDLLTDYGYSLWSPEDRPRPYKHRLRPMTKHIRKRCIDWFGPQLPRCAWEIFAFAQVSDVQKLGWRD